MAKQLNLSATWHDDTLRVAWNDVKANDQNKSIQWVIGLVWFPLFLVSMFTAVSGGGFAFMGILMVALIVTVIWFRSGSTTVPNHVNFGTQAVTFKGRNYATTEITRFDYGVKSQLTGITPQKDGNGNSMSDPSLIRMWINDSAPVTISENNWSFDVCHEIRDALAKALDAIRNVEKKQSQEKEFGEVNGDFGMPDY
ncbi:hypothetical protein [Shimia haliotis]|uniref:Uncharacterized protein n=1 Tax=Shimia haliotis TaxID=1280847 RepID=A0A1I4HPF4_9RHOB|nr:hypothetical protein [Shimia haliotis]SFL44109.1 hypothetical protein SAMN04488036_1168 [Shimia haliotis]